MNLTSITKHIPAGVHRGLLIAKKYSPEILTGVGIACGVASTVLACKGTLKINDILDEHNAVEETMRETLEKGSVTIKVEGSDETTLDEYTEEDYKRDKIVHKVQTGRDILMAYAPAIGMGVLGVTCILSGHHILNKRNVALAAAYSFASNKLGEYRGRVIDELGEEKDKEFYYGLKSDIVKVKEETEDGKTKTVKKTVHYIDPNSISQYARFFDDASRRWVPDAEMNLVYLRAQQNYCNDLLHSRGHLFLNEVYDILDIPRTSDGAVVGWVVSDEGDNFVDFGIYSAHNDNAIDFVNGYEKAILLDFNVDGVIYDLI